MNSKVEIISKQLEAYNNHELEKFCSFYSENIYIYDFKTSEIILKGQEELKIQYEKRFANKELHANLLNRIEIGNYVIDHEEVTGLEENKIVYAIAIYEIKDGKIIKVSFIK